MLTPAADCSRAVNGKRRDRSSAALLATTADPEPVLAALAEELDQTYRQVAARLPNNPAVTIRTC